MHKSVAEIADITGGWPGRITALNPKNVLELGTGQGAAAAKIMSALAPDAVFTTINYDDGEVYGAQLIPWRLDPRLLQLTADTIDPDTLDLVIDNVDLLFIDTTHEAWHAATELRLWQSKLINGAIVIVDDLDHNDMAVFWDSIPYEKAPHIAVACQGVFRYDALIPYAESFQRRKGTTYGGGMRWS